MAVSKSSATEAYELSNQLLADLELGQLALSSCVMKAARLARLVGDDDHLMIFRYELSGYPSLPTGVPAEVFRLCRIAERVKFVKRTDEKGTENGDLVEGANTRSIATMEENASTLRMRLSFFQPQPINLSSANPNQYVHAPRRDIANEAQIASNYRDEVAALAGRRSFVYNYVLAKHFELRVSSAVEDVFDEYRQRVDERLGSLIPDELRRLDSIRANLESENPEDWANAGHSCRRLLQAVADALYPPSEDLAVAGNGKPIKVGPDNYINRLVLYCENTMASGVSSKVISSDLKYIGERLDSVFNAAQKGSHSDIDLSEAKRFVIHTYLVVGDILELHCEASAQLNLELPDVIPVPVADPVEAAPAMGYGERRSPCT